MGCRNPKGPLRTKNTTAIAKIVNYYAVVFLLRPPNLVRHGPFFERTNVCNSQENGVRTRRAAIVNHPAVLKIVRVVNLLRVVFLVRRGPLGFALRTKLEPPFGNHRFFTLGWAFERPPTPLSGRVPEGVRTLGLPHSGHRRSVLSVQRNKCFL